MSTLPLAGLQHMQQCQVGWNIPLSLFAQRFLIQMNGVWKMVSSVGVLKLRTLSHESSALITQDHGYVPIEINSLVNSWKTLCTCYFPGIELLLALLKYFKSRETEAKNTKKSQHFK